MATYLQKRGQIFLAQEDWPHILENVSKRGIVGRDAEQKTLAEMLASKRSELLALYGRRRIGKTYLIRQYLGEAAGTYFEVTGTKSGSATLQRRRFREALESTFLGGQPLPDFRSWEDALSYLSDELQRRAQAEPKKTIVIFFDELPWLATPRAGMLEAIDYHWNARWSKIPQLKVVLCGSAASWMLRRIVHAKSGLHNRLTRQIRLAPLSLAETDKYLKARGMRMKPRETLELYLALGGVPYYLDRLIRSESVTEAIGRLCFERDGPLRNEFDDVFASLFEEHEEHMLLLRTLAKRAEGMTRQDLVIASGLRSGGGLNRRLQELEESGFIARIAPYGSLKKSTQYRVIDEFTLFYLRWMDHAPRGVLARGGASYFRARAETPSYKAWQGYAFEGVCLKHARELQRALGIDNLVTSVGTWRFVPRAKSEKRRGAQVDLLFDRRDNVINLCELKFSNDPYVVSKSYARELKDKMSLFAEYTKTRKRVILTLVSPYGLKPNTWSEDLIDRVVDATALFRS